MEAVTPRFFGCVTDVGRHRQDNEDAHVEAELPNGDLLLVVCDGVGGHEAGEVASAIASETIRGNVLEHPTDSPRERLAAAVKAANQAVLAEGARTGKVEMGTTAVVAWLRGHEVSFAHVGDSRAYVFRGGATVFRTRDHTRVQRMIDAGIISARAAKEHPEAHVILRALGREETADGRPLEAEVLSTPFRLEPGDTLLLCSDGLYDVMEDHELWEAISGLPPAEAAQRLVDGANDRGGPDNITATVMVFGQERAPKLAAAPPEVEPDDFVELPRPNHGIRILAVALLATAAVALMWPKPEAPTTTQPLPTLAPAPVVPAPAPPDAGAAASDAGAAADAGGDDAGTDAGEPHDAGALDAGEAGGGAADASHVDAGTSSPDAGATKAEAGATDAGTR